MADTKTTAETGAPKWFSLSLAANPTIMDLPTACRKAAIQLQNALLQPQWGHLIKLR